MQDSSKNNAKLNKAMNIIFILILFLYPMRHVLVGAEWTDTGYNYGNFTYMDKMDPMWMFSTYLANTLGNLFTHLPFGNTMIGLNVYTGLMISILAVAGYLFFVKEVKLPSVIVFIGEFLAINFCWCPTALLYNYLTYLLLGAGVVLLYYALTREKKQSLFFVLAGICLGINVFVRFSNLANMALIVAVWAMGIIRKEKVAKVVQQTLWCVLGYVLGMGAVFGYISLRYGAGAYIQGVKRLLSMPAEASSYTITSMIVYQIRNYLQNVIWLGWLMGFVILGTIVYKVLPKSMKVIKNIGYTVCVFGGFYVLMCRNMFNMKYSTKLSVFQWAVFLLTATMIIGVIVIFSKKFTQKEKLLCGLGMIQIVITPLGSNNHLYSSINNLFFVLPFTLWMLWRFWKMLGEEVVVRNRKIPLFPLKSMMICVFCMIMLQGTMFGWTYVFSESDGGENLHTKIENNDILSGMRTSPDRAKVFAEISEYVSKEELKGREVILYGHIPAMSYYLEMPFAISSWPDLPSYNYSVMEADLQAVQERIEAGEAAPVLLLEKVPGTFLAEGREGLEALGSTASVADSLEADRKLALLKQMIEKYGYTVTFSNDKFVLFLAKDYR